jgi:hypothetical protein
MTEVARSLYAARGFSAGVSAYELWFKPLDAKP